MNHIRHQLRDAFKTRLTGLAEVGNNVFVSRIYNITSAECPAICIYTEREEVQDKTPSNRQPTIQQRRVLTAVIVVCNITEDGEIENELDKISLLVEDKIFEDPTFQGLSFKTSLLYAEKVITEVDRPLGMMRLLFESLVLTQEGDAAKAISQ